MHFSRYKENWSFEICSWSDVCFELTNGWLFASLTFAKRGTCHVTCARLAPIPFLCKPCFAWMICMHVRQCCKCKYNVLWQRQCYWPPFTPHTVSLVMTIGKTNEEVVEGKAFLHINSYMNGNMCSLLLTDKHQTSFQAQRGQPGKLFGSFSCPGGSN